MRDMKADARQTEGVSPWAPFGARAFTVLWVAMVISNVGTWMNDVGSGWLMTTLVLDPFMVALVQAATTAPIFLLALPAGAVADIVDRRKLLIVVNSLMAVTAGVLATLVMLERMTAELLLLFTFLLGAGAAFIAPAWQAIVPQLVPRDKLGAAIALNSMGINVSRAIGPALAGVLIVALGIAAPFALNALSFIAIVAALAWWRGEPEKASLLPPERIGEAMLNGLRYAWNSTPLRDTLVRAAAFFLFASAYWALLPVIAKTSLQGDARVYGVLLGCVGVGAVLGAILLPKIRPRLGPDRTVAVGTLGTAGVLAAFALVANVYVAAAASLLAGGSWIFVLSSLQISAQTALPNWVRARGLSLFLTVFFGAMALGSVVWGKLAAELGIPVALLAAAGGALLAIPLSWKARLNQGEALDLAPSMHWPAPVVALDESPDRGPVMTTIEYQIAKEDVASFLPLMGKLSRARRRNGAIEWRLMEDAAHPGRFTEYFLETSWLTHLRHHERVSSEDRGIQESIRALHRGDTSPTVRHYLAPDPETR
jgi:MFS family permease